MSEKLSKAQLRMITAEWFTDGGADMIYLMKAFYVYRDDHWQRVSDDEARSMIFTKYISLNQDRLPPTSGDLKEITEIMQSLTFRKYSGAIHAIMDDSIKNEINLKSSVLDIDTFTSRPHSKEWLPMYRLDFDYNPAHSRSNAPFFFHFIRSSMEMSDPMTEEDTLLMDFIQQFMGYSLTLGNPLGANLIMYGDGRNGKGVFMKVLENMLGRANISHSDLKDIDDPRKVHITRNKLVNFSEDLEKGQQLDTSVLKRAAVGEMVTADEKFKDPYEFKFTAKMIVACNKKPYLKNVTTAIKERWYLLPFTKSFIKGHPERIEGLEGIIIAEEMETVFSWAVDGLKTLMRNKSFTPPERCRLAMEEYLVENSPILCWLEDGGLKKDGSGIRYESKGSELYQDYRLFCKETENFPGKIQDFYAELKKNGYHVETRHNARYVKGLAPENATGESEIDDNVPF